MYHSHSPRNTDNAKRRPNRRQDSTLNKYQLKAFADQHRHRLINAFNFECEETAANCAYILTQFAIKEGYVQPRDPVKGETLRNWAKDGNPPAWACKAACDILLGRGYNPLEAGEWAALTQTWLEAHGPFTDVAAAKASFPAHVPLTSIDAFVQAAFTEEANIEQS